LEFKFKRADCIKNLLELEGQTVMKTGGGKEGTIQAILYSKAGTAITLAIHNGDDIWTIKKSESRKDTNTAS
jgi:hypothetical protein